MSPIPPVRRAADVVRSTIQTMARLGFGGQDLVARTLARAGWRVSARSVARYRKERTLVPPTPGATKRTTKPVIARFVHHTWMMDVSIVNQLLGPDLHLACVFDAFSRVPLVLQIFDHKPGASDMSRLLRGAAKAFRSPRYLITDLGGEFTAAGFAKTARRLGLIHRFGAAENLYATARLERFWRSLKESARLRHLGLPLTVADLEHRLALALTHYVVFRPHEGLGGTTPAEVFLELEADHTKAVEPPRGRPGEWAGDCPFAFENLDAEGRFPILTAA